MTGHAPIAVGTAEAAQMTGTSEKTIRRAIAATDPHSFPPPLKAHRKGRAYAIRVVDLDAWVASWPAA